MPPKVSVIIPTYERANLLERALRSVLNQTYRNFELIVVDDGSTDETALVMKKYPHVIYLQKINSGVSRTRNLGIARAGGEWMSFLDSDDEWFPKKLETQMNFFEKNPEIKICQTEEIWVRNGKRVNPMKKHKKYGGLIFKECLPLCIVSPSAVTIHKTIFEDVGTFDESLPACEDYDLWLRISAKYEIGLIDEPLITKYGGHADQLSKTIPTLDLYRIKAIQKILDANVLNEEQTALARKELAKKKEIYEKGCLKRGKTSGLPSLRGNA